MESTKEDIGVSDIELEGDSKDYDVLLKAFNMIPKHLTGLTCEIGLRRGGGTQYIINALARSGMEPKVHIAVDPYGDLLYPNRDNVSPSTFGYTNQMRDETIGKVHQYALRMDVNFMFFNMTDVDFFDKFHNGVIVHHDGQRNVMNQYIFVHLDGPHQYNFVMNEFYWFNQRMLPGAVIVFDDIKHYNHDGVEQVMIQSMGNIWTPIIKTSRKAAYIKTDIIK